MDSLKQAAAAESLAGAFASNAKMCIKMRRKKGGLAASHKSKLRERAMSKIGWISTVAAMAFAIVLVARPAPAVEDHPATHNMLVVGTETVFLSHLPMFDAVNKNGTDYTSPHRYQGHSAGDFSSGFRSTA
jgi:hypothetical protein